MSTLRRAPAVGDLAVCVQGVQALHVVLVSLHVVLVSGHGKHCAAAAARAAYLFEDISVTSRRQAERSPCTCCAWHVAASM
jgi:hypothetical protein